MKVNGKIKIALLALPILLGVVGFLVSGTCSFLDAVFRCVTMYVLNYGDTPPNALVELARWTAPLAAATGILLAFMRINECLRGYLSYLTGDSIAVYGPEEECAAVLAQLGRRGIRGRDKLVRAHRYILLDTEEKNLEFYDQHREKLRDSMVYLRCVSLSSQAPMSPKVKLFSEEETAARLFWKQKELYAEAVKKDFKLNIVFLGFGRLGEELLYWGLQDNVFHPDQRISYHIFGDGEAFAAVHRNLTTLGDPVRMYAEPWYKQTALLQGADLVLVLEQREQTALLRDLRLVLTREVPVTVFTAQSAGAELLVQGSGYTAFDWKREADTLENILEDRLCFLAKSINLRYAHLYNQVEETPENREVEWAKLDSFTRYSNISSADFHELRLGQIAQLGLKPTAEAIEAAGYRDLFAELEHIRWCRYHYLNNWTGGVPANGKNKDAVKRIHKDLVPYGELTDGEKAKDWETVALLLELAPEAELNGNQ